MDVYARMKKTLCGVLGRELTDIDLSAPVGELGLSSLGLVELIVALEEEFDISIPNRELKKLRKVKDVYELIRKMTGA